MPLKDRDSGRKYLSENKKRKLARKRENSIASQKEALDKFFKPNVITNQQKETVPHQNELEYQPYTEEVGASQQITKQLSSIDNNVRKEDPATWRDTVSGQLKKYLLMQGPAPLKKVTFPRYSRGRCFSKHYC